MDVDPNELRVEDYPNLEEGKVIGLGGRPDNVNVGPFHCAHVPDSVRGGTVGKDNIPVILYESRIKKIDGKHVKQEKYAVMMPPTKDPKKRIGVVCAGCYAPGMTLWDISRCVNCRTFVNHLDPLLNEDPKDKRKKVAVVDMEGFPVRKRQCLSDKSENSLTKAIARANDTTDVPLIRNLNRPAEGLSTEELISELKRRDEDFEFILPLVNLDTVVQFTKERGVKHLYDARFSDLEAKMRRVTDPTRPEIDSFYAATQVEDKPHYLQASVITLEAMIKFHDPKKEKRKGSPSRLLDTASFEDLEHMMRFRVLGTDTTKAKFFAKKRKRMSDPHFLDEPVVTWDNVSKAVYARYRF
jgi:hypothetical protein